MYMYIYNKFCVHSHYAAKGFLFSPPPSEMFGFCNSCEITSIHHRATSSNATLAIPSDH